MGGDYQEKYYQRALEKLLLREKIPFKKEVYFRVILGNDTIGKHFIDFVIDDKIALDLKKGRLFRMGDIKQMLMYLKTANLRLGILAYFSSNGVRTKRIVNKYFRDY